MMSRIGLPETSDRARAGMPSASRYSRERGVYGSSQSLMWSMSVRLRSSGTRRS